MTNFRDKVEKLMRLKNVTYTDYETMFQQMVDNVTDLHDREVERIIGEDNETNDGRIQTRGWRQHLISQNDLRAEQRRRANGEGKE